MTRFHVERQSIQLKQANGVTPHSLNTDATLVVYFKRRHRPLCNEKTHYYGRKEEMKIRLFVIYVFIIIDTGTKNDFGVPRFGIVNFSET